jgi:hypothetical protein
MTNVHQLFARAVYDPNSLKVLGHAFERAWANMSGALGERPSDVEAARTVLAKVILNLPSSESDAAEQIAAAALDVMASGYRNTMALKGASANG